MTIDHLFILGAGFSYNAGLPLAAGFTRALLDTSTLSTDGPSDVLIHYLRGFVDATFGNSEGMEPDDWPALEDIFTLVDLAANTGHHLGVFSPSELRTVRRALIVRLIRMLSQQYNRAKMRGDSDWKALEEFFHALNLSATAVLNLNWDTAVERGLFRTQKVDNFEYGCGAVPAEFNGKNQVKGRTPNTKVGYQLLKPHGSINWLYCDACREIYWLKPVNTEKIASTLFRQSDWQKVYGNRADASKRTVIRAHCYRCGFEALGTRLATFSYRKALDFPMHANTWRHAESLLMEAKVWVFIGYSMPGADYEFKHLLKRVELSRKTGPEIIVITGGGAAAKETKNVYTRFFGASSTAAKRTYFLDGLDKGALKALYRLGALNH